MLRPFRWIGGKARGLVAVGTLREAAAVVVLLAALAGLAWWWRAALDFQAAQRGAVLGQPSPVANASGWPLATNVALESRAPGERRVLLQQARAAGLETVRQRFPWAQIEPNPGEFAWEPWDDVVRATQDEGLRLIALLDGSPAWARDPRDADNPLAPPHDVRDFGRFAGAFAARYGQAVDFYQVWDEPNIYPHWGERFPDPGAYVTLLREAATTIRAADPATRILSAGLAPTTETGGPNQNEIAFLEGVYQAGGADAFDILGAKAHGFWSGPEDRRADPAVLNFSRLVLLREVMERAGDGGKAIWAVEGGWNALPEGWLGPPSPWGTDDEVKQAGRTLDALARAEREWPWLGLMAVGALQPQVPTNDPRWGFALLDPSGQPRLLLRELARYSEERAAGVGTYPADAFAAEYEGAWRLSPEGADVGQSGDRVRFRFRGTRLDVHVRRGDYWAVFYVTVDGVPANALPRDEGGRAYLVLYDPLRQEDWVTLARGLGDDLHEAELVAEGGWGQWALRGWSVARERPLWAAAWVVPILWGGVALCLLGLAFLAWPHVERPGRDLGWRVLGWVAATAGSRVEASGLEWPMAVAWVLCGGVYFFAPWLPLGLVGLLGLIPLTWVRPDLGLALVTFGIPFFLLKKPLGPLSLSTLELLLAVVAFLLIVRSVVQAVRNVREGLEGGQGRALGEALARGWRGVRSRWGTMDLGMVLLVVGGGLSLLVAEMRGVALREFRVVILESALFYFLLRGRSLKLARGWVWRLADALVGAAVVLALWGLAQYLLGNEVIQAEGVRRVRALYGSPNNLALFLERVAPLAAAYVVWGRRDWRKGAYGGAFVVILLGLYLTFSRGAWLLGLPVAFLVMGALGGRRTWLGALGVLVVMAVALVPFLDTSRLLSLFDLQSGTAFFRLRLWESTWNMILDHPVLGVGPDNFLYLYRTRYVLPNAWEELNLSHPHNLVLDFWSRIGLLGLAALALTVGAFFRKAFSLWRRAADADTRTLALGLMGSLAGALAHGLIDNAFFLVDLAFVYAWTMGLIVWLWEKEKTPGCAS
ncbi:MAG: O-antigen ligase family protein [Anaerolineae bacterium]